MAYREKPILTDIELPQLPTEWDDLRKWARQYIKRHSHTSQTNPYADLASMHASTVAETVAFIDDPLSPNVIWPHASSAPISLPDRAAAIMALANRLPTLASLP